MKIRLFSQNDIKQVLDIYAFYIKHTAYSFETKIPTVAEFSDRIAHYASQSPCLVAEKADEITGYAYASPHRSRVAYQWNKEVSVYVKKEAHRKGVGKNLYTTLFELLKMQGYANVLAGITQPNPQSVIFHKKMGFKLVGTYNKIGFKNNQWWDVNWYELFLQKEGFVPKKIMPMEELIKKCPLSL